MSHSRPPFNLNHHRTSKGETFPFSVHFNKIYSVQSGMSRFFSFFLGGICLRQGRSSRSQVWSNSPPVPICCDFRHPTDQQGHFYLRFALIFITPEFTLDLAHLLSCRGLRACAILYDAHAGLR
jgi:hypothetical protein